VSTHTLVIEISVEDIDPTIVDPHEVADEIMHPFDEARKAGNTTFEIGESFMSAEWGP
jgi:hypothetical protein